MKERKEYIFTAELDDKFMALGFDNILYSWDKQTGKMLGSEESKD